MNKKPLCAPAAAGAASSTEARDTCAMPATALGNFLNFDGAAGAAGQPSPHAGASGQPPPVSLAAIPRKPHDRLTPAEAAAYLVVQEATLATWRSTRRYALEYIKIGRKIFYTQAALDKFIAARTVTMDE